MAETENSPGDLFLELTKTKIALLRTIQKDIIFEEGQPTDSSMDTVMRSRSNKILQMSQSYKNLMNE